MEFSWIAILLGIILAAYFLGYRAGHQDGCADEYLARERQAKGEKE